MSAAIVQRFYMWLDENISLVHLTFPCDVVEREGGKRERERERGRDGGGCLSSPVQKNLSSRKNIRAGKKKQRKKKTPNIPDLVWLSAPWRTEGIFQPTHGKKKAKIQTATWLDMNLFFFSSYFFCQRTGWSLCVLSPVASRHSSLN